MLIWSLHVLCCCATFLLVLRASCGCAYPAGKVSRAYLWQVASKKSGVGQPNVFNDAIQEIKGRQFMGWSTLQRAGTITISCAYFVESKLSERTRMCEVAYTYNSRLDCFSYAGRCVLILVRKHSQRVDYCFGVEGEVL